MSTGMEQGHNDGMWQYTKQGRVQKESYQPRAACVMWVCALRQGFVNTTCVARLHILLLSEGLWVGTSQLYSTPVIEDSTECNSRTRHVRASVYQGKPKRPTIDCISPQSEAVRDQRPMPSNLLTSASHLR